MTMFMKVFLIIFSSVIVLGILSRYLSADTILMLCVALEFCFLCADYFYDPQ